MGTCIFIFKHKVEAGCTADVTYTRTICIVRPEKEEQNRTQITIGGNLLDYPGEEYTNKANL